MYRVIQRWRPILRMRKDVCLTTITLYKPNGDPITYADPTNVKVESGVLTFYWTKEISGRAQKIVTTVPFLIQHDIAGM